MQHMKMLRRTLILMVPPAGPARLISTLAALVFSTATATWADTYIFQIIDVPFVDAAETELFGIDNAGHIVGSYEDANGVRQGFVLKGGVFETISVSGATDTRAFGINDAGQITGRYLNNTDEPGVQHGFLRQSDGTFIAIDFPGQTFNYAWGVNDVGQVSGY
jgi:uncharacterized membrane protein